GRGQRLAVGPARHAVEEAQRLEGVQRDRARAVVGRALAQHDQVARVAGGDERALEARDQAREQRGGDHHERHHAHREQGARAPRGEVGERVAQRQQHAQNTSRSVCATGRRAAPNEGTTPELIPTNSARNSPCTRIVLVTTKLPSGPSAGSQPATPWRSQAVSASAPKAPSTPPRVESSVASAKSVPNTSRREKPSAFSTAISPM